MCSKTWLKMNSIAETIGFSLSIIFQTTLLFLIFNSPKSKFGTYKYLMIWFSAAGIFYSTCNFLCKPNVHITETTFVIFMVLEDFGVSQVWGTIVIAIYSSCFGMMLSLLTLQFYYRFVSVSSPLLLSKRFSLVTVPKFIFLVFGFSIVWGSLTYFINGPNYLKNQELEPEFQKIYCLELQEYSYIAAKYFYSSNSENEKNPHWPSFIVMSIMTPMMGTNFSLLMFFGFKTYSNLRKSRISSKKDIQHQLFRTLVLQTLIPLIFMYLPVSCLFYFPIFGIQIWDFENFIPISVAIYPCLEPLVAIFCIKLFRVQIIKIFACKMGKEEQVSSVQINSHAFSA